MSHSYTSPHNMTLEFAMAFGWVPGLLALVGTITLAWMTVRMLTITNSIFVAGAAIGCLVELTRVQFSGDVWDGFGLLVTSLVTTAAFTVWIPSPDGRTPSSMTTRADPGAGN